MYAAIGGSCSPAYAAARICDPEDRRSCIQAVERGEPSPFSGILSTDRRAAQIVAQIEQAEARATAEVRLVRGEMRATINGLQLKLDLRDEFHRQELALWRDSAQRAIEAAAPLWYERPVVVAVATAVITVGALTGAIKVLDAAAP